MDRFDSSDIACESEEVGRKSVALRYSGSGLRRRDYLKELNCEQDDELVRIGAVADFLQLVSPLSPTLKGCDSKGHSERKSGGGKIEEQRICSAPLFVESCWKIRSMPCFSHFSSYSLIDS